MTTALTYDQVMEKLPAIVADCLAIDLEEVTPDLVFSNESIELLDLNFRCERAYGIKSPFRLLTGSRDLLTVDADGYFTDSAMALIRQAYPFLSEKLEREGVTRLQGVEIMNHLTVEIIARIVVQASEQQVANAQAA